MAGNQIGTASIGVRADASKFRQGIQQSATSATKQTQSRLKSGLNKSMNVAGRAMKRTAIGAGIGAGIAVGKGVADGFKKAGQQESAQKVLSGLYSDADLAKKTLKDLHKVSVKSPIESQAYREAAEGLAYAGVKGDDAIGILENVGKQVEAVGGGAEEMDRVTQAMTKMASAGEVNMQSLNQLSDAGIPIMDGLADHFGTTNDKIKEMASDGAIEIDDVMETMRESSSKTAQQMNRGAEENRKSFVSEWRKMKDELTEQMGNMFGPVLESLKPLVIAFRENGPAAIKSFSESLASVIEFAKNHTVAFSAMSTAVLASVVALKKWAAASTVSAAASGKLRGAVGGIGSLFMKLPGPLKIIAPLVIALGTAFGILVGKSGGVNEAFSKMGEFLSGLGEKIASMATQFAEALPQLISAAGEAIQGLMEGLAENLPRLVTAGQQILESLITGISENLPILVQSAAQMITQITQSFAEQLPRLVTMAQQLLQTLTSTIAENLPILATAALKMIQQLATTWAEQMPRIMSMAVKMITTLIDTVAEMLPRLISMAVKILMTIVNGILENLPKLINAAIKIVDTLVTQIIELLPKLIKAAIKLVTAIVNGILENLDKIINAAVKLVITLVEGLLDMLPKLIQAAFKLLTSIVKELIKPKNLAKIISAAVKLVYKIIEGLVKMIPQLVSTAGKLVWEIVKGIGKVAWQLIKPGADLVVQAIKGIGSKFSDMYSTGKTAVSKLWNGIKSMGASLGNGMKSLFKGALNKGIDGVNAGTKGILKGFKSFLSLIGKIPFVPDLGKKIDTSAWAIQPVERGGELPHHASGTSSMGTYKRATAIVGEGKTSKPEYVVPTDPKHRKRAVGLYRQLGQDLGASPQLARGGRMTSQQVKQSSAPKFGIGGLWGKVKDAGGWVAGKAKSAADKVKELTGKAKDALKAVSQPVKWAKDKFAKMPSYLKDAPAYYVKKAASWVGDKIKPGEDPDAGGGAAGVGKKSTGTQTKNAKYIAKAAKAAGVGKKGLTVALATAFQESGLKNISYGDRDSVGLFQQRPSQGWGSVKQILDPVYSANKFFAGLKGVSGWKGMRVTKAAQTVQRSAYPEAYQKWVPKAKALANKVYDSGGWLPPGMSTVYNGTGKSEAVFTQQQLRQINSKDGNVASDRADTRRGRGDTTINMNVRARDLGDLQNVQQFVAMLEEERSMARVRGRIERSGTVSS